MSAAAAKAPEPDRTPSFARRIVSLSRRAIRWIPLRARLAVLAGVIVLIGLAVYMFWTSGTATLQLVCRHNFRTAELAVSIDGKLSLTQQISGSARKQFGVFGSRVAGSFSKSLTVPPGEHLVEVHLKSATDRFDQTKRSAVNLLPGKDATLLVTAQRGSLSLFYQGPRVGPSNEAASDYSAAARSFLFTVMGSALSATVGYIVQEFLRSRKTAQHVESQDSKPAS